MRQDNDGRLKSDFTECIKYLMIVSLLASGGLRTKHQIMRRTSLTLFGSSRGISAKSKVTWKSKSRGTLKLLFLLYFK